jgi:hypothetical protein
MTRLRRSFTAEFKFEAASLVLAEPHIPAQADKSVSGLPRPPCSPPKNANLIPHNMSWPDECP